MNDIASIEAFANLTPDHILDSVEALGVQCDGRFLAPGTNKIKGLIERITIKPFF